MASDVTTLAAQISNGIQGLFAREYGRGPERARTYFNDECVVVVLHGGLLANEERFVQEGEEELVRQVRQHFERLITPEITAVVADATGRRVLTYHSQILFHPTRTFELFVLDEPPARD
jgi:uncharacterized protein YbcI